MLTVRIATATRTNAATAVKAMDATLRRAGALCTATTRSMPGRSIALVWSSIYFGHHPFYILHRILSGPAILAGGLDLHKNYNIQTCVYCNGNQLWPHLFKALGH